MVRLRIFQPRSTHFCSIGAAILGNFPNQDRFTAFGSPDEMIIEQMDSMLIALVFVQRIVD